MSRRKRPRLFSFAREVELGHVQEVAADPSERALLEEVVDAFLAICQEQALRPEWLEPVVRAARHPGPSARGVGITRLAVLSHYFDEAGEALRSVAADPDEEVRVYAAASLPNTPEALAVPLLGAALADASWRVRKTAAQACSAFPAAALVPVLEAAVSAEGDARVRVQLDLSLGFQRRALSGGAAPPSTGR